MTSDLPKIDLQKNGAKPHTAPKFLIKLATVFGFLLVSTACTVFPESPPAKLYVLELKPSRPIAACQLKFALRDVKLPGVLDRPEVLLGLDNGRAELSGQHLWAAPLSSELTRLVGQHMQEIFAEGQLMPYPIRARERPDWIVAVSIAKLSLSEGQLNLVLHGSVLADSDQNKSQSPASFTVTRSHPLQALPSERNNSALAARFVGALASAVSDATQELSERIGSALCK